MLTRICSVISIAIVTIGGVVVLGSTPASASGGACGLLFVCVGSNHHTTGHPAPTGHGGGGGSGKTTPIPCPAGQACGSLTVGNAPAAHVPTIDIAQEAKAGLWPPNPEVHTSPANKTYVQLRTGLWIKPEDFRPLSHSTPEPIDGQVATAHADPKSVTWSMGESTVVCDTAGTPNGTSCSYTYNRSSADQPGGKYAISATVTWDIYWTCEGTGCDAPRGSFAEPTTSTTTNTTLAVGEVQTESRPG